MAPEIPLCKQHWSKAHPNAPKPWIPCLLVPHAKLCPDALRKLETLLYRGPNAKADGDGYLYQFVHAEDHPSLYKVGFTSRTPERRLSEWPGARLCASWATPWAHFAESLVHVLLDHWRVYRYIYKDIEDGGKRHALSLWKETREWLEDAEYEAVRRDLRSVKTWCPKEIRVDPSKVPAKHHKPMEKEWFCVKQDYLQYTIRAVVDLLNRTNWREDMMMLSHECVK